MLINAKLLQKITEKWPVKVLSVAAALIISIFYRMNTLETRFFSAPLRVITNETLVPVSSLTHTVRVSLRGENDGIQQIMEEDIEAYVDIGKYTNEGTYRAPVQIRKKGSALGVAPLEISVLPIEITLVLEQKIVKSIPVFPVFMGSISQGFELADRQIIPDTIIAEGPSSALEGIKEFNTEIIDIDRRYENFSVRVNIINDNPLIVIHGDRMIEFRGTINRIIRGTSSEVTRGERGSRASNTAVRNNAADQNEIQQTAAEHAEAEKSDHSSNGNQAEDHND